MFIDLNNNGLFTEKYPHLTAYMCTNCRGIDAFAPAEGKVRCTTCLTNIQDPQGKSKRLPLFKNAQGGPAPVFIVGDSVVVTP